MGKNIKVCKNQKTEKVQKIVKKGSKNRLFLWSELHAVEPNLKNSYIREKGPFFGGTGGLRGLFPDPKNPVFSTFL